MHDADTRPLVSVALATCNGARFLVAQLDSIYAQSVQDIEVVACDDCSDDDTVAILERFASSHQLRVFRNPRRLGVKQNFETALRHCSGRFLALADQDDCWHPDKLARLLACQRASGASLVYSDAILVDEAGASLGRCLRETLRVEYLRGRPSAALYLENFVTGCTVLCKRELLELALPLPEGAHMHDWWLAFAATLADGIEFVDAPLLGYRQHAGAQLGARPPRRLPGVVRLLDPRDHLQRLARVRRWRARNHAHLSACATLERRLGRDPALADALLEWLADQRCRFSLARHRALFEAHPELFAALTPERRPAALRQRLWSVPRLALVSVLVCGIHAALLATVVALIAG